MITIKSLAGIRFPELFEAFSQAFNDYEIQLDSEELKTMLHRRGFLPELSFGAFDDNKLVAFTCNGIGSFNGTKIAYDTGTGTVKEYRGQGLAGKIFNYSIPFLKEAGIFQYLLEVLQHNTKAISVYKKLGFCVSREFNYFVQKNEDIKVDSMKLNPAYAFKPIDLSQAEKQSSFCDFIPSWQNSFEAISRKPDNFTLLGVFKEEQLLAYGIFEAKSGDITQIAVEPIHRRKGIGSLLLKEMVKLNQHNSIKCINAEIECGSITEFLKSNSILVSGKQFEMIMEL
ncbi:GNAT family N-acetyltransferase [Labilibaculum sp.]|uniref:GNAT family N-acetyltransferase n=1 Tax=Labilibaculum sp. TaxID=2060723 RepID=UPI002AA62C4F|nr:GNAT family N-acetyltransferase [Labilibaculum sp.]